MREISLRLGFHGARGLRLLIAVALASASLLPSVRVSADPVLYRVTGWQWESFFGSVFPEPQYGFPPVSMTQPGVANVVTNGTQPASVFLPAGDIVYSSGMVIPTPPTVFGIFWQRITWQGTNLSGTLAPDPSRATFTVTPNGFEPLPPFFTSTAPQATQAFIRVKPGPGKFGGVWDSGVGSIINGVLAKVGGGFTARTNIIPTYAGGIADPSINTEFPPGLGHATNNLTSPVFSSTVCPTTPATCPWFSTLTGSQIEVDGVRWTTGNVTAQATFMFTLVPPTVTIMGTGTDNRTGPMSSMGTLQLVSAENLFLRGGGFQGSASHRFKLGLSFLPEPRATQALAAGAALLIALYGREQARRRKRP